MNQEFLLIILGSIIASVTGLVATLIVQKFKHEQERRMILRNKRFEKEYEITEKLIKDISGLLVTVGHLSTMIGKYFEFKNMLMHGKGRLSDEEMIYFVGNFKLYAVPNMKVEEVISQMEKNPDGTLKIFRNNIVKYYVRYIRMMMNFMNYANKHNLEFYFQKKEIISDIEFLRESVLEINKIYIVLHDEKDGAYEKIKKAMDGWCDGVSGELTRIIKTLQREIDEAIKG